MIELSNATLGALPAGLTRPAYDRSALTAGIVHLGTGAFHRGHQALYVDDLLAAGLGDGWAILGAGVRRTGARMRDALVPQDGLYTVTEKPADGAWSTRVVGSITGYLLGPDDPAALIERIAAPATKIVSLTITEGGYEVDQVTGLFQPATEAVLADLATARGVGTVQFGAAGSGSAGAGSGGAGSAGAGSVFGVVVSALRLRRERGLGGLTIMSCDNVQENGRVTATAFLSFADAVDPATADWMRREVAFPSSMVDRVVPGPAPEDNAYLERAFAVHDRWPVTAEPFRQWVLEDVFAAGRPRLEEVGVDVVTEVEPYEIAKLRLANGTHQAVCFLGYLLGHTYVHEAITDPAVNRLVLRYIDEEAVPTLTPIAGLDLNTYARTIVARFSNPEMRDPLTRICAETSDRIPKFLLPVVHRQLELGGPVEVCATVVAAWARYALGTDERGNPIEVVDPRREAVQSAARAEVTTPGAFLHDTSLFGDLAGSETFVQAFHQAFDRLRGDGVRAVLRSH